MRKRGLREGETESFDKIVRIREQKDPYKNLQERAIPWVRKRM